MRPYSGHLSGYPTHHLLVLRRSVNSDASARARSKATPIRIPISRSVPAHRSPFTAHAARSRNPGGVRFGSAEIYDVLEQCFAPTATHAAHAVADCLAVGQSVARGTDERVVLFVKLLEGQALTAELEAKIRTEVRTRRSARHVPARVSCVHIISCN